jgi:hypothetical protein
MLVVVGVDTYVAPELVLPASSSDEPSDPAADQVVLLPLPTVLVDQVDPPLVLVAM